MSTLTIVGFVVFQLVLVLLLLENRRLRRRNEELIDLLTRKRSFKPSALERKYR